jgi:hypothetical protein
MNCFLFLLVVILWTFSLLETTSAIDSNDDDGSPLNGVIDQLTINATYVKKFQSLILLSVSPSNDALTMLTLEVQKLLANIMVESYNERNIFNPEVCDPWQRTAVRGSVIAVGTFDIDQAVDQFQSGDQQRRQNTIVPSGSNETSNNILLNIQGLCFNNCPTEGMIFMSDSAMGSRLLQLSLRGMQQANPTSKGHFSQRTMLNTLPERKDDCQESPPTEQQVLFTFNDKIATSSMISLDFQSLQVLDTITASLEDDETIDTVSNLHNFDGNLIFAISPDIGADPTALATFVSAFIDSYNEGNARNPSVCDPFNRVAIAGKTLAEGFDLAIVGGPILIFGGQLDDLQLNRSDTLDRVRRLEEDVIVTESLTPTEFNASSAPSFSPSAQFQSTTTTNLLVNVLGVCNNCPDDISLFNDVQNRRILQNQKFPRGLQSEDCRTSPNPQEIFGIFEENLRAVLPQVQVFSFIDIGSTATLGSNFSTVITEISENDATLIVDLTVAGSTRLYTENVLTSAPTPNPTPAPTKNPTARPTDEPTPDPKPEPTREPNPEPTPNPTLEPTDIPPTTVPTNMPLMSPTKTPSAVPTTTPSFSFSPTTCEDTIAVAYDACGISEPPFEGSCCVPCDIFCPSAGLLSDCRDACIDCGLTDAC